VKRLADLSPCGKYRYTLTRTWGLSTSHVLFLMLNPSNADDQKDDPTIRRCISLAKAWGYDGIYVGNLFAYRSSVPRVLKDIKDPVGPENDMYLEQMLASANLTIAAWGANGALHGRADQVRTLYGARGLGFHHLGLTMEGYPKHPLARGVHRIPNDVLPQHWGTA
jgi:hypothetical protein